ncbi:MAG: prephenate dehydratase [Anaerovibrio sp.]|nr:prephenate dehydratase [Anaerovibrio sp.]
MKQMGFLGPLGTHSEAAAIYLNGLLPEAYELVPCANIYEAIHSVEQGGLASCLVPVENSIEGSINITLDTLAGSGRLCVVRELVWRVHNNLMVREAAPADVPVRRILSHSQPLSQCREFIRCNYPLAELEAVASTAMAAKLAAAADPTAGWAAICTQRAGELNGLRLVADNIEDQDNNSTRFYQLVSSDQKAVLEPDAGGAEKALIICQIDGKSAGRLCEILMELASRNVNLTRIESRPARTCLGEYIFFLDVEMPKNREQLEEALSAIRQKSVWLRKPGEFSVMQSPD